MTSAEAVPERIHAAGLAERGLAEQGGAVNLVGPADSVSAWMPGGAAASAADELATTWRHRVTTLDGDLDSHGTNLQFRAARVSVVALRVGDTRRGAVNEDLRRLVAQVQPVRNGTDVNASILVSTGCHLPEALLQPTSQAGVQPPSPTS